MHTLFRISVANIDLLVPRDSTIISVDRAVEASQQRGFLTPETLEYRLATHNASAADSLSGVVHAWQHIICGPFRMFEMSLPAIVDPYTTLWLLEHQAQLARGLVFAEITPAAIRVVDRAKGCTATYLKSIGVHAAYIPEMASPHGLDRVDEALPMLPGDLVRLVPYFVSKTEASTVM